jgi:hypothetical protein
MRAIQGVDAVDGLLDAHEASNRSLVQQLMGQPSGAVAFLGINRTVFSGDISVRLANKLSTAANDQTRKIIDSM